MAEAVPARAAPPATVVVLNWNGWRDTLECLRSLERLAGPAADVVVVDNGSSDESVARLRGTAPTLLSTGRNLGFAGGCNVGIRHALERGASYVWLLNNDTTVEPDALAALVRAAESASGVGLVGSVLRYAHDPSTVQAWGGGRVDWRIGVPRHLRGPAEADRLDYIVGASLLVRRAVFEDIGLLDEGFFLYWEDVDFALRARRAGWRLAVAGDSVVYHKEGGSASGGARVPSASAEAHHLRSLVRLLRKHRRFWLASALARASLEVPRQIRYGRPGRIPLLLRTVYDAIRS